MLHSRMKEISYFACLFHPNTYGRIGREGFAARMVLLLESIGRFVRLAGKILDPSEVQVIRRVPICVRRVSFCDDDLLTGES